MEVHPSFLFVLLLVCWPAQLTNGNPMRLKQTDVEEDEDGWNFEGDMILTDEQKRLVQQTSIDHLDHDKVKPIGGETSEEGAKERGGIVGHPSVRWPDNTLSYEFDSSVTGDERQKVQDTLTGLQAKLAGCITFREASSGNRVLVKWPSRASCSSQVGHTGWDTQDLNLGRRSCYNTGTIEHEFLHALGVWHQQSRSDRDDFVKINVQTSSTGRVITLIVTPLRSSTISICPTTSGVSCTMVVRPLVRRAQTADESRQSRLWIQASKASSGIERVRASLTSNL